MEILSTEIPEVLHIKPRIFEDDRGYFFESYNQKKWEDHGHSSNFVQDNESFSSYGIVRGLHYQTAPHAQAKLVRVALGTVLDVTVDIRENSPTYGRHVARVLSAENKEQLFIPRGFAHGFVVLSEKALFIYKCDGYYHKDSEGSIRYDDPTLNIDWRLPISDIISSAKDASSPQFGNHKKFLP